MLRLMRHKSTLPPRVKAVLSGPPDASTLADVGVGTGAGAVPRAGTPCTPVPPGGPVARRRAATPARVRSTAEIMSKSADSLRDVATSLRSGEALPTVVSLVCLSVPATPL